MHGSIDRFALALIFGLFITASHCSAEVVIDDFSFGSILSQTTPGTSIQTSTDSSILGGSRDESITVRNPGVFGFVGFGSALSIGQSNDDQIHGFFTYDDFTGLDLSEGGINDQFRVSFSSVDTAIEIPDVFTITVIAGLATQSIDFAMPGSPKDVWLSFEDFDLIDFTNVDSIQLSYDFLGNPGRDFTITSFTATAIPEPNAMILLLSASSLLGLRRRNK